MVFEGFKFMLNIVTGPGSRINILPFSVSYVRVDFPERRFQVVPCNWPVQNRLVSHKQVSRSYQNEWHRSQLRPKPEFVLRKEEGPTGQYLVIPWRLQIESAASDCMRIQYETS